MDRKLTGGLLAVGIIIAAVAALIFTMPAKNTSKSTATPTPTQTKVEATLDYKSAAPAQPKTITAKEGQLVKITVTSDVADEAHLHGYDIMKDVTPTEPAVIEFTANKTGRFEIELESLKATLAELEVNPA